jgi:predicted RNase H-like nuclease
MSGQTVAGVDWAGGEWLAVVLEDGSGIHCRIESDLESLWESPIDFDRILIDVPIGLPDSAETLAKREKLDSFARTVTGRSSSVFPVPARAACEAARDGGDYETVVNENKDDLDKGLSWQSYYIAAGTGEVDAFLLETDSAKETVIESHPEVCFRGLLGEQLEHSKNTAQGIGERLEALGGHLDDPGTVFSRLCRELVDESADITVDDVVDALGLCVVASYPAEELRFLPGEGYCDSEGLPMQMAYWCEESLAEL